MALSKTVEFAAGGKEAVTIRHLLTHAGGIRTLSLGWPAGTASATAHRERFHALAAAIYEDLDVSWRATDR